ncbi:hypothetical protein SynBIOSE41_02049 [Synechococcus sp. BIOS-E4-1]|nr:hypothetical protein SynBIOSE41_02049 [Synechococcus sp. BIOS-E4-1]
MAVCRRQCLFAVATAPEFPNAVRGGARSLFMGVRVVPAVVLDFFHLFKTPGEVIH